jgi:hypothetical protein
MNFSKTPICQSLVLLAIGVCVSLFVIEDVSATENKGGDATKSALKWHALPEKGSMAKQGSLPQDPVCISQVTIDEAKCRGGERGLVPKYRRHFQVCSIGLYETSRYQYGAEVYANIECVDRSRLTTE